MGAFDDAINMIVTCAGDKFLERHGKDAIDDAVRWARNTTGTPSDYLEKVCQILLLERHLGARLINHAFCELNIHENAEEILQDFGLEKADTLLRKEGKDTDKMSSPLKAALILSTSLPGSDCVASYIYSVILERNDWKHIVECYSKEEA